MHPIYDLHISLNILFLLKMYKDTSLKGRFISDLPYLERLAVMDLEPLELRRIKKSDLTMHFKIYNNMSALPSNYVSHATIQYKLIMRPSSLGGGHILRRTLSVRPSVCLSVCPSVPLADVLCLQLHRLTSEHPK